MMNTVAPAFAALILGACATAQSNPDIDLAADPRVGDKVERICFTSGLSGFGETTDQSVVLQRGSRSYLVTTRNRCRELDHALSLAIDSFSGCLRRGDQLIGLESAFGRNSSHNPSFPCFVDEIYEWDRNAKAEETDEEAESETDETALPPEA